MTRHGYIAVGSGNRKHPAKILPLGTKIMKPKKPKQRKYRRCQWMMEKKNFRDCGKKATHVDVHTTLAYCEDHATFFRSTTKPL